MPLKPSLRPLLSATSRQFKPTQAPRCFSSTIRSRAVEPNPSEPRTTHFGFETVAEADKEARGVLDLRRIVERGGTICVGLVLIVIVN